MVSLRFWQLEQAQAGTLAFHLHVDYPWGHSMGHGFDSEEEEEEKVGPALPLWVASGKSLTGPALGRGKLSCGNQDGLVPTALSCKTPSSGLLGQWEAGHQQ